VQRVPLKISLTLVLFLDRCLACCGLLLLVFIYIILYVTLDAVGLGKNHCCCRAKEKLQYFHLLLSKQKIFNIITQE
jgi:hypothetical protein